MGTKNNPGEFYCYANALPDEPMFVLLARDPTFFDLVEEWAARRETAINRGERPESDRQMVREAQMCALAGSRWRRDHDGEWRKLTAADITTDGKPESERVAAILRAGLSEQS